MERKCLVQRVTGIGFLSDPLELVYFLAVAFKSCLEIKRANSRRGLVLWKQSGNNYYFVS